MARACLGASAGPVFAEIAGFGVTPARATGGTKRAPAAVMKSGNLVIPPLMALSLLACSAEPGATEPEAPAAQTSAVSCEAFDPYTAALASHTVDCQHTIGPTSFRLNARGVLVRNFSSCVGEDKLSSIDDVLGLQYREQALPGAGRCIRERWLQWRERFATQHITSCPVWEKQSVVGTPDELLANKMGEMQLDAKLAHENYVFRVLYPEGMAAQPCGSAAECAEQCAGGFSGYVLSAHESEVIADPTYWLLDTVYPSAELDPFMRPGYFHPMSYYGPLPGAIFGNRNRSGEKCSYYRGGIHFQLPLKLDCTSTEFESCVTECLP